jgi:hypothetical protein
MQVKRTIGASTTTKNPWRYSEMTKISTLMIGSVISPSLLHLPYRQPPQSQTARISSQYPVLPTLIHTPHPLHHLGILPFTHPITIQGTTRNATSTPTPNPTRNLNPPHPEKTTQSTNSPSSSSPLAHYSPSAFYSIWAGWSCGSIPA